MSDSKAENNNPGKRVCNTLREVRRKIAAANNIPFDTTECTFTGRCLGTCPACDAEVTYLDSQLQKKKARGEKINITGISVRDIEEYNRQFFNANERTSDVFDDTSMLTQERPPLTQERPPQRFAGVPASGFDDGPDDFEILAGVPAGPDDDYKPDDSGMLMGYIAPVKEAGMDTFGKPDKTENTGHSSSRGRFGGLFSKNRK